MSTPAFTMDSVKAMHLEWHRFDAREGECPGAELCSYAWLFVEIERSEARIDFCPEYVTGHAWNHVGRDWISCSGCHARLPSIEAVRLGRGPQLQSAESAFAPPAEFASHDDEEV